MGGQLADIGGKGSIEAVRMATEDFGKTVLGRPIEVVSADHQNKADIGSAIATRWFDTENVEMITDLLNSAVALGVQEVGRRKDRITMVSGAGTSDLTNAACSPTGGALDLRYLFADGRGRARAAGGGRRHLVSLRSTTPSGLPWRRTRPG